VNILSPIYVDLDADCLGVQQPVSFANTTTGLNGLTIQSSELAIKSGSECVLITRAWQAAMIDGAPGGVFWMRGILVGFVTGEIRIRLSNGEHDIVPFEFQVLP
jgi:hypothetical protein